jgi:hypothetical protein
MGRPSSPSLNILPLDFFRATPYAIHTRLGGTIPQGIERIAAMRQLIIITLLMLGSEPVLAGWVAVEKQYQRAGLETVYFDPETIVRQGQRAALWQLTDIKWNNTTRFLSTKAHKEFDCAKSRVRVLQVLEFSRQMGTGKSASGYIEDGRWQPVETGHVNQALWKAACKQD